jgi:hypothetical protein
MKKVILEFLSLFIGFLIIPSAMGARIDPILGPQSEQARGEQHVLMVAVRFPDVSPTSSLEQIQRRAVQGLNSYIQNQSYGLTWVKADFRGWVPLSDSISKYKISQYNYQVDERRIKKIIEDTMTAIEKETDFSKYQHMLIIPGVFTKPGVGYGMGSLCANPGMLTRLDGGVVSTFKAGRNPYRSYLTVKSKGGKKFDRGIYVVAESCPLNNFAYEFVCCLGGLHEDKRLVQQHYDYDLQSDPSVPHTHENFAIYMGPWDITSQVHIRGERIPAGLSSFTKIRLGWISSEQVVLVKPGEMAYTHLSPLARKDNTLAVKIPLKENLYYLVENRQPIGFDRVLPDSGILIFKVDTSIVEGNGPVKVMDADPKSRHFSHATFRLDRENRNLFTDKEHNVVVIPLWSEGGNLGVLVTTHDKSNDALKAASMVQKLLQRFPEARKKEKNQSIEDCIRSFKNFNFKTCIQIAEKGLKD